MKTVKNIAKMIAGLLIGMFAGLAAAGVFVVLFTDTTLEQYIMKFSEIDVAEGAAAFAVGAASFVVSLFVLIMLHEAGHLVGGLMSGYRFVSFRVFNYTFIKVDGRLRVKKFAIAGTGGQCLLAPPDVADEAAPVTAYNLGGLAANVLVLSLLPLLWLELNPFLMEFLVIFLLTDVVMLIINGIPMAAGGVGNDAYNQRLLGRSQFEPARIADTTEGQCPYTEWRAAEGYAGRLVCRSRAGRLLECPGGGVADHVGVAADGCGRYGGGVSRVQ